MGEIIGWSLFLAVIFVGFCFALVGLIAVLIKWVDYLTRKFDI